MPKYVVHHEGHFVEWSTVVDAPISESMSREEMLAYLTRRYGEYGAHTYPERLDRAERHGTSSIPPMSAAELFAGNRAGGDETELSFEQIIAEYFRAPA